MQKFVRIAVISLLSIAVLFGALLAYLAFGFDANQFKTQIVQLVKDKKQRTLVIDGDIKLSVFPSLGVDLGKTSLSAQNSSANFATLKSAHISLALLPLLRKEVLLDSIAIDGLDLTLERQHEDSSNADDLLNKDESSGDPVKFDIKGIALTGASIHIKDTANNFSGSLNKLDFSSGRIADKVATELKFSTELDFQQPALQGKITVQSGLSFDLAAGTWEAKNLDLFAKGSLNKDAAKAFDVVAKASSIKFNSKDLALAADNLALAAKGPLGQDSAELNLEIPKLAVDQQNASGDTIKGNFKLSGTKSMDIGYQMSGVSGSAKTLSITKLLLDINGKDGSRSIAGKLQTSVNAQPEQRYFSLPDLRADLQIDDPAMPQKMLKLPVKATLMADLKKKTLSGTLNTQFDESTIKADFAVDQFDHPSTQLELAIDKLNLDRYLSAASPAAPHTAGVQAPAVEKPMDLSALKKLQLKGSVQIGQLQVKKLKLSELALPLKASEGVLSIAPLSAKLYQGTLAGSATVNANSNSFSLRTTLTDVNVNPLLKDALDHDILEGRGKLILNLTTTGKSTPAMKQALDGDISIELHDGAVKGINLAKSLRDFKSKILNKSDQQQAANASEKTDFSSFSASMHFHDGIGKSDDLSLKSPFLRVGGTGTLNVVNSSLDYLANVVVVNTAAGQGGADLGQLKNITVPVRINGPLTALGYQIQWSAIATGALKSVIEDKAKPVLEQKKEELKGKLQDRLKGLFGH
ncbi:AsmA family protein [Undibacterium terreum]|uniref:Cell envelope biogenesis protein AsmA n=1 Tax=Undibacterium terreum TaxID=1224302 RepID=A0A916XNF8_9BURK|nr:AsmA family protein [Undibacterium terreum]GGC85569.1 cell envelope biogenesis protein AsmA [Undibacterium terreum]